MEYVYAITPILVLAVLLNYVHATDTAISEGRNDHRAGMLFPLLLSLSQRLAALLSSVMMGLVALAATLLFAKKAFLLSAAALAIAAWDANRRKSVEPAPEIHLHHRRIPVYHQEYYPEHYDSHEDSYKNEYYGNLASHESNYASASQNYGAIAKPQTQQFSPSYGIINKPQPNYGAIAKTQTQQYNPSYRIVDKPQQFYGQTSQANNEIPYRSPYRYRKGRGLIT